MKLLLVAACVLLATVGSNGFWFTQKFAGQWLCEQYLRTSQQNVARISHILDCHKFLLCMKNQDADGKDVVTVVVRDCPAGTRFSSVFDTCRHAAYTSCNKGPCSNKYINMLGYYRERSNCAAFWQCDNYASHLKCCPAGTAWNAKLKYCDWDATCTQTCTPKTFTPDSSEEGSGSSEEEEDLEDNQCTRANHNHVYEAMSDKSQYTMISKATKVRSVNKCPAAMSSFSLKECGCVAGITASNPNPGECVSMNFDTGFSTSGKQWVSVFNAKTEAGAGYFDGTSSIDIPHFANMDWRDELFLELKFKSEADNPSHVNVLTNGDERSTTMEIEVDNRDVTITLRTVKKTCKAKVKVENVNAWNIVQVKYEGFAGGKGLTLSSGGKEDNAKCEGGKIRNTEDPITLGKGLKGYIDDVMICKKATFPMLLG